MFSSIDAPFLTPDPSTIRAECWHYTTGEIRQELPRHLQSWTQGTSLRLTRNIQIDRPAILKQTGLPDSARLGIAVSWMSNETKIRRKVFRADIRDEPLNVIANLNGDEIGGMVTIRTTLVLNESVPDQEVWIAEEVGSVLLREETRLTLGSGDSGFPMAVLDFAATHLPPGASWHLETSTSLESRFSSSFQVLVNERDKKLVKAMEAEKPTKEQALLIDGLLAGVMSQTLQLAYALRQSGELDLDGYEYGSVGEVLGNLVKRTGDVSLEASSDSARWSLMRTQFEDLTRELGVGRLI